MTIDVSDDPMELDETDRAVLRARIRDTRMDVREIAKATGIVANRVDDRLTRLERTGVLQGYTAQVDYEKLGYDVTAIVQLSTTSDDPVERLRDHPQFVTVYAVTGSHDVFAIGKFRDTDELNATVTELVTDHDVADVQVNVTLDVCKEFEPFTLGDD